MPEYARKGDEIKTFERKDTEKNLWRDKRGWNNPIFVTSGEERKSKNITEGKVGGINKKRATSRGLDVRPGRSKSTNIWSLQKEIESVE